MEIQLFWCPPHCMKNNWMKFRCKCGRCANLVVRFSHAWNPICQLIVSTTAMERVYASCARYANLSVRFNHAWTCIRCVVLPCGTLLSSCSLVQVNHVWNPISSIIPARQKLEDFLEKSWFYMGGAYIIRVRDMQTLLFVSVMHGPVYAALSYFVEPYQSVVRLYESITYGTLSIQLFPRSRNWTLFKKQRDSRYEVWVFSNTIAISCGSDTHRCHHAAAKCFVWLGWSGLILADLGWFDEIWIDPDWSGLIWADLLWSGLIRLDLRWSGLGWSGLIWPDLEWSGVIWFDLGWSGMKNIVFFAMKNAWGRFGPLTSGWSLAFKSTTRTTRFAYPADEAYVRSKALVKTINWYGFMCDWNEQQG